ncbi:putative 2-dehydropantoate 2-reductase [Chishuiella sp.]|uniref:putative 2-dehydropantoate 2-reductase n=1 Tax=Chishuiella sp. TaxID=1969467 RepID=UPI0028AB425D|nr:putative 2-dehydropantoate 2-reductase [Chishuiella sp.]
MKIAVIGTGALGGFYGGMLAKNGNDVHFLLNSDYDYVVKNGLTIESDIHGTFNLKDIHVYNNINEMPICDVILVCLKSTKNSFIQAIKSIINDKSIIVIIQNGLGVEEEIAELFPNNNIIGALAFIASNKIGPGHIHHLELGRLKLGSYNQEKTHLVDDLIKVFKDADVDALYTDELKYIRWQKLIWNMAFNGACVILNCTTDQLLLNTSTREMIYELMRETIDAAKACGVNIPVDEVEKIVAMTDRMKPYNPSMKLDYDNKREMELKYIYEKPIEHAKAAGFEMKKMKTLLQLLHFKQAEYFQD